VARAVCQDHWATRTLALLALVEVHPATHPLVRRMARVVPALVPLSAQALAAAQAAATVIHRHPSAALVALARTRGLGLVQAPPVRLVAAVLADWEQLSVATGWPAGRVGT
jgi:hypothetical protein